MRLDRVHHHVGVDRDLIAVVEEPDIDAPSATTPCVSIRRRRSSNERVEGCEAVISGRQQFGDPFVDEGGVGRIGVAPRHGPKIVGMGVQTALGIGGRLVLAVRNGKVEVGGARHDDGFRRYGFERQVEVAAVTSIGGDVGQLPRMARDLALRRRTMSKLACFRRTGQDRNR